MTKEQAADILLAANTTAEVDRQALLDGDQHLIRSVYLGAFPKGTECPPEVSSAVRVLTGAE